MKKEFLIAMLTLMFFGCSNDSKTHTPRKVLDFGSFKIETPTTWKKIKLKGIDSKVGGILTERSDTVFFDFGKYSPKFNTYIKVFKPEKKIEFDSLDINTEFFAFSNDNILDESQGVFLKEYYDYDTINGIIGKIKAPKKIGDGITGIHFNNPNNRGEDLTLWARNLDTTEQFLLLKAFNSIKIIGNSGNGTD